MRGFVRCLTPWKRLILRVKNRFVMLWMSDLYKVCFRVSMVVGCIPIAIFSVIGN